MKTWITFSIFCLSAMVATAARGERPNIIMFLIDDQNPSSIAAFGGDTYIPKDASPGPETSAQFKHNERWMRRHLTTLGFSWAKNVYPENMHRPYGMHYAEWTTVAALEFIEENQDGPFYRPRTHFLRPG